MDLRDRAKALRKALGLTQEGLAARGGLRRVEVNKVETGRGTATSHKVRLGLARGFGLSVEAYETAVPAPGRKTRLDWVETILFLERLHGGVPEAQGRPLPKLSSVSKGPARHEAGGRHRLG